MAITSISKQKLSLNKWEDDVDFTAAGTAADGVALAFDGDDCKTLVIAYNTHATAAKTVTVKKGNGIGGVNDIAATSIAAGDYAAIRLDSQEFKNVSGDNKGKVVIIPESTDVKFALIELP